MKIATAWSTGADTEEAADEMWGKITGTLGGTADWVVVYNSVNHDTSAVARAIADRVGDIPTHGATSCLGVMTGDGFHTTDGTGLGMLAISDPNGSYGVGVAELHDDPRAAAREALAMAIDNADRLGEPPGLVWLAGVPGAEEQLLAGIHDLIGTRVPIAGGSSADNTIEGQWQQFSAGEAHGNAVVVSALYPSAGIHHSFHSGYSPTETSGTVTKSEGRRVYEIDGLPAGTVYAAWSEGAIDDFTADGGNILAASTMWPLGRRVDREADDYVLAHPATLHPDNSIDFFADIDEGDELVLMHGSAQSLVTRAGRVATAALSGGGIEAEQAAGALVVYCAGCMLAVQDDMDDVAAEMRQALAGRPFLGTFTFGEQGCFVGGDNYHGNLMISVVAFEAGDPAS